MEAGPTDSVSLSQEVNGPRREIVQPPLKQNILFTLGILWILNK